MKRPEIRILEQGRVIGATVTNGQDGDGEVVLGTVADLIVNSRNNRVGHAVLASGGTLGVGARQTVIAWDRFRWDSETSEFTLAMTAKQIEHAPEFDAENPSQYCAEVDGEPGTCMLATAVGDCAIFAGSEDLGSGARLFVEPNSAALAFVSVPIGGVLGIGKSDILVPWNALRLVKPTEEGDVQIQLGKNKSELESAPKLGDEGADLNQVAFRMKVYEFYGVKPLAFESKKEAGDGVQ